MAIYAYASIGFISFQWHLQCTLRGDPREDCSIPRCEERSLAPGVATQSPGFSQKTRK